MNLEDREAMAKLFKDHQFEGVVNLAAQVGVRYSIEDPLAYIDTKQPFSTHDGVNHPVSLYAATKKANELMAHTYSHLYDLPTTGLRFFTVYGPYDRPDMALQKFTRAIMNDEPITVFNYGKHRRDFTR
jgi:UDP-glucuronate 4-epimerase